MACRLCLRIPQENPSVIHLESLMVHYGLVRTMLRDLNIDICIDSLICKDCINMLHFWKVFKQKCLDVESKIEMFKGYDSKKKMSNLVEVIEYFEDINKLEYEQGFICRLCLSLFSEGKRYRLDEATNCALRTCLQKFDPKVVDNPLMCETCAQSVEDIYNFFQKYQSVQKTLLLHVRKLRCQLLENKDILNIAKCRDDTVEFTIHLKPETVLETRRKSTSKNRRKSVPVVGGSHLTAEVKLVKNNPKPSPSFQARPDDNSKTSYYDGVEIEVLSSDSDDEIIEIDDEPPIKIEIEDHDLQDEVLNQYNQVFTEEGDIFRNSEFIEVKDGASGLDFDEIKLFRKNIEPQSVLKNLPNKQEITVKPVKVIGSTGARNNQNIKNEPFIKVIGNTSITKIPKINTTSNAGAGAPGIGILHTVLKNPSKGKELLVENGKEAANIKCKFCTFRTKCRDSYKLHLLQVHYKRPIVR